MEARFKYRGRKLKDDDIAFIQALIAENPAASRRALSQKVCQAWNWMQSNGTLCDMICRSLMPELDRAGHIVLPPVRWTNPNPLAQRRKPKPPQMDTTALRANLSAIRPPEFRLGRRTGEEPLFNDILEHYHFLGYTAGR